MYCFPLDKARTSVIKPFPCLTLAWFTRNSRRGTPPNYYPPSMTCLARGIVINRRPEARVACEPRKGETGKRFNDTLCVLCQGENNTFGAPAGFDKDIFEIDLCSG